MIYYNYMSNRLRSLNTFTMDDIALELGLSKSTVSRALSGSGRISAETVRRVEECAKKHGFRPNLVARALAGQCTLNIAAVMPSESSAVQMMFFHECLLGMVSSAEKAGYSVLVCITEENCKNLETILLNRKVDAVVLTQLLHGDKNLELLKKADLPFVVIGSGAGGEIAQVDSKMCENCAEFTKICASKVESCGEILFVCGSLDVEANNNRLSGFLSGMESLKENSLKYAVCTDVFDFENSKEVDNWNLILCSDDIVCLKVLEKLKKANVKIGKKNMIASFHDSILLEMASPPVSAVRVDAYSLGSKACDEVIKLAGGEKISGVNYIDCSFQFRESTDF